MKAITNETFFTAIQIKATVDFLYQKNMDICNKVLKTPLKKEFQDNYETRDNIFIVPIISILNQSKIENENILNYLNKELSVVPVYSELAKLKNIKTNREPQYDELSKMIYSVSADKEIYNTKQKVEQKLYSDNISDILLNNTRDIISNFSSKLEGNLSTKVDGQMNRIANKYIRLNQYGSYQQIRESEEMTKTIAEDFVKIYSKVFFDILAKEEHLYRTEIEKDLSILKDIENYENSIIDKLHNLDSTNEQIEKSNNERTEEAYAKILALKNNLSNKMKALTAENKDLPPAYEMKSLIEDGYSLSAAFTKLKLNMVKDKPSLSKWLENEQEENYIRLEKYQDIAKIPFLYNYMKEVDFNRNAKEGIYIGDLPFNTTSKEVFETNQHVLLASLRETAIKGSIDVIADAIDSIGLSGNQDIPGHSDS